MSVLEVLRSSQYKSIWESKRAVKELLKVASVDECDDQGCTALIYCAANNNVELGEFLISSCGANVNQYGGLSTLYYLRTPLWIACSRNALEFVTMLLSFDEKKYKLSINSRCLDGKTPLAVCCRHGFLEICKKLLTITSIDVNASDNLGRTPLLLACLHNQFEVVKVLLSVKESIDVNAADDFKQTPLFVAANLGHSGIVNLLCERQDIDVNFGNLEDVTALHVASQKCHFKVVLALLRSEKLDLFAVDSYGHTALDVADSQGEVHPILQKFHMRRNCISRLYFSTTVYFLSIHYSQLKLPQPIAIRIIEFMADDPSTRAPVLTSLSEYDRLGVIMAGLSEDFSGRKRNVAILRKINGLAKPLELE